MTNSPAWTALDAHCSDTRHDHMRELFAEDPSRFDKFSLPTDDLVFDYSKNRITEKTIDLLLDLARERGVEARRDAMAKGEAINTSENRPVLHMALRGGPDGHFQTAEGDVSKQITASLEKLTAFVNAVHSGDITGSTGKPFTDVVNIGIGGSHLGPEVVTQALSPYHKDKVHVHFVSNVDGHDLQSTLSDLDPATTLFLIASKTFTTSETMTNARSAQAWLARHLEKNAVSQHFAAISANADKVAAFGIVPDSSFEFWDWVGGRYSLWSSIGLPIALTIGNDNFLSLLAGAREMDAHFLNQPLEKNMPVMLALIGIWNTNFLNLDTLAILPYDQRLNRFPSCLQQLEMESNGKSTTLSGEGVNCMTSPVVFGEAGTSGQHAFYQQLHQGTKTTPADFIVVAEPAHDLAGHHEQLLSNALAQSEALMRGRTLAEADDKAERVFEGNRPSNTILVKNLGPRNLGKLIALYEHKVFVQGVIWGINSFDQWGVELGKELAGRLLPMITDGDTDAGLDVSTHGLLAQLRQWRG